MRINNMNERTLSKILSAGPGILVVGFGIVCILTARQMETSIEKVILLVALTNMVLLGLLLIEIGLISFTKREET